MTQEKWLTNQLLDLFDTLIQVKKLKPVFIYTRKKIPVFQSYTEITPLLRMLLLAIAKYQTCIYSVKRLARIAGVKPDAARYALKVLAGNQIIKITPRVTDCGDDDSNCYEIDLDVLCSFFDRGTLLIGVPVPC